MLCKAISCSIQKEQKSARYLGTLKTRNLPKYTSKTRFKEVQKKLYNVLTFIDELCETNDPLFEEKSGSVYDSYRFWCSNNGFMAKSVKSFKREMKRLGYNQKRKSAGMYYVGVKLKPSHPSSIFRPT